ncbi:uncharacterized protein Z518_09568 [Rhinocladiella mackenziei CBS 650.93]|uniref:Uncharacterized protein n=1 Tax=Rhinocladiella mackenziei CBS 650.93 TaxID=1442369 RepID=A0A0D2IF05_9EURO|nr:uncharacterized protein Z518_09568 [Rhinocladiella mackenziei CBS 650.93]KIX01841.1 hypothetical protein Z518_09568 [Rhinocladiella mackenziei CBS 650.93]
MLPPDAVWFVTGCSSGIGVAIARHVVSQGHRLIATARKVSTLSYLPDSDPNILKLPLDVCSLESIDGALHATLEKFGRLDVMINNAGYNSVGIAEVVPESTMRLTMETNFWGPMRLTRKAVAILRDVNPNSGSIGGTIVNVTSIGGRLALPAEAAYHASKFALEGFTEAITSELHPDWKIRVMLLEPGGTKSQFTTQSNANSRADFREHSAYQDENMAVNQMIKALSDPGLNEKLIEAERVAKTLFDVLEKHEALPMRLPTGKDAYGIIRAKESAKMDELERWKSVTESVGDADIPK